MCNIGLVMLATLRMLFHTSEKPGTASSKYDTVPNSPAEYLDSAGLDYSGLRDHKDPTVSKARTYGALTDVRRT